MATNVFLRDRVSLNDKMAGNVKIPCPHCGQAPKRKKIDQHPCVITGHVAYDNGNLVRVEA